MPRCRYIIPSTKHLCKKTAIDGSQYCTIHATQHAIHKNAKEAHDDSTITLPMPPPAPSIDMSYTHEPSEITQVTSRLDSEISSLKENFERLFSLVQNMQTNTTPIKPKTPSTITTGAVTRRAEALFYNEFKTKNPDVVASINERAVKAGLIPEGAQVHWGLIKEEAKRRFKALSITDKSVYMQLAREMLEKNMAIKRA